MDAEIDVQSEHFEPGEIVQIPETNELARVCMCDGGGGVTHLRGDRCTSGDIIKEDDERDFRAVGFDALSKEERSAMARRGVVARRRNAMARKLAELQAYTEAHKELASQLLGAKSVVLDGLIEEMTDPATGEIQTSRLDEKRLKLLLSLIEQIEKRGFGAPVTKSEVSQTLDIRAAVVDLTKALQKPDTV